MVEQKLFDMRKVEIIIGGEQLSFVKELLSKVKVSGYTIIPNISGMGHHGFRSGHLMFNETSSLAMVVTVVPEVRVESILSGMKPVFSKHSGVMIVSDCAISRPEYFEGGA